MRRRFRDCGFNDDVKEKCPPLNLPKEIGACDADRLPGEIGPEDFVDMPEVVGEPKYDIPDIVGEDGE